MDASPEERLKRFISYGNENLSYYASNKSDASFREDKVKCVKEMIERDGSCTNCVTYIVDIVNNSSSPVPYTALYALATCIRICPHKSLEESKAICKAYTAVRELVDTDGERFLIFTYFLRKIVKPQKDTNGLGSGWRKTMIKWYESKPPVPLLEMMLDKWKVMSWSHRDILRLCRMKPHANPERDVIYVFALYGYNTAYSKYKDKEQVQPMLQRMNAAEELRKVDTPSALVNMITLRNISDVSKIPIKFIRNAEIWRALIPRMKLDDFLSNINRMAKMKLFKKEELLSETVKRCYEADPSEFKRIHPLTVFLIKQQYKLCLSSKVKMKKSDNELTNGEVDNKIVNIQDVTTSKELIMTLNFVYGKTLELSEPIGHRYCIAVDGSLNGKRSGTAGHYRYVSAYKTALCIASSLLFPDNVASRLVTFVSVNSDEDIHRVIWTVPHKNDTPMSTVFDSIPRKPCKVNVARLVNWARLKNYSYDVFVVLSDNNMVAVNAASALQSYRENMVPDARLLTWSLPGKHRQVAELCENHMFHMIGFDKKSPYVLEKFLKNEF